MKFSVIICTYNPDHALLRRVINAVLSQDHPASDYEIVLVDNNSANDPGNLEFIRSNGRIKRIREKQQGLVYARLAGLNAATGKYIVFADDDNILEPGYLSHLSDLFKKYDKVAVWGPGKIELEFTGDCPQWIRKNYSGFFQAKNRSMTEYGSVRGWPEYYPAGSGMSVTKEVMNEYARAFHSGEISSTGRKGDSLSSGEDSQIVWTAVKMGMSAGTSPGLKLIHVIPPKRTTRKYLASLNFGIASSYVQGMMEMFPETAAQFKLRSLAGKVLFVVKTLIKASGNPVLFSRLYTIDNSWFKGVAHALKKPRN